MKHLKTYRLFEVRINNAWKSCGDCGKLNPEDYWFNDWEKYIPKSKIKNFICISCLEKRVGRELKKSDFEPWSHYYQGQEWFEKLED